MSECQPGQTSRTTDSLRTRIAAVLWNYFDQTRSDGYIVDGVDGDELADVVISELGLKRASRPSDYQHVNYPPGYQYITDWIADD